LVFKAKKIKTSPATTGTTSEDEKEQRRMKKEDLVAKGLNEEQAKAVITIYEEEMKGYIPKSRFDELNEAKKSLETQIADRDKQLETLKDQVGDNKELQDKLTQLEKENKANKEKYEADILKMEKTSAVKDALADSLHPELLMGQFDLNKITKNADGSFSGISEQLEAQKKAFPDMFAKKLSGKTPLNNGKPSSSVTAGGDRITELQKIIDDPKIPFAKRIAAKNEMFNLQKESEE
jgi:chromosome segregation ATPase